MRLAAVVSTLFALAACQRPAELQPSANGSAATGADATADARAAVAASAGTPPTSSAPTPIESSARALDADEASAVSATVAAAKRCDMPFVRPPDFRVHIENHALPIRQDPSWTGWEVHAAGAQCPLEGSADDSPPCKALSPAALERLYAIVRDASPCTIVAPDPAQRSSPHYGRRHIVITVQGRQVELSDSSRNPLKGDSLDRFRKIYDAVVVEANAVP